MSNILSLPCAKIRRDGGTQVRVQMDPEVAGDYALLIQGGVEMPAIIVFHDKTHYWLADGFQRLEAHLICKRRQIVAEVRDGTQRDAILFAVGANVQHGLRRSNADKRNAVSILLQDTEWSNWTNREIARQCAVDEGLVRKMRVELSADNPQSKQIPQVAEEDPAACLMDELPSDVQAALKAMPAAERYSLISMVREESKPQASESRPAPSVPRDNLDLCRDHLAKAKVLAFKLGCKKSIGYIEKAEEHLVA